MRHLSITLWLLSVLFVLGGCGGAGGAAGFQGGAGTVPIPAPPAPSPTPPAPTPTPPAPTPTPPSPSPAPPASSPTPPGGMIIGNWSFTLTTGDQGTSPLTIAGSVQSSGASVTGTMQGDWGCSDQTTSLALTGTLNGDNLSMTSTTIDGQVVTLTGNFNHLETPGAVYYTSFTGTYTITGGCAAGLQGSVSGVIVPFIDNPMDGTFQSSLRSFNVAGNIAQSASVSSDGSFGMNGNLGFDTPCFSGGSIKPGTYSSGSFILGEKVTLEVETSNGVLTFLGTVGEDGSEISGYYTVSGGSCPDKGTAVLRLLSPWDY